MKRFTICTIGVFLLGLGLAACEEGAGARGNEIEQKKMADDPKTKTDEGLAGGSK